MEESKESLDKIKDKTKISHPDTKTKKSIAKYGMTISMGALLVTGLVKGKESKALHVCAGLSLIGFSWWHYTLYPDPKKG